MTLKLDLGAGAVSPEGFTPVGHAHGTEIFPLAYADESVDAIRASHVLEHFSHRQIPDVLKEWTRVLRKGGKLQIAVPDFTKIAEQYLAGERQPTEAFLMGGQVDGSDYHKALFDRERLRELLSEQGYVLLRPWTSDLDDCAAYPISLNIEGTKPYVSEIRVSACMSIPRLGFMDNHVCAMEALVPLGIKLRMQGGAFWGQALTNCMEDILEADKPDAILTLDYDTVFSKGNVATLLQLMMTHGEADAIAPVQSSRHLTTALFTKRDANGDALERLSIEEFEGDLTEISSAHFGLTLLRADKLRALPKPWFMPVPDSDGRWRTDKIDEDIGFWVSWRNAGNTLFLANRVPVGHLELAVRWPGEVLQTILQPVREYKDTGRPTGMWK